MLNLKGTALTKGLTSPVSLTSPPGDANRVFIVEQPGRIRIVQRTTGAVNPVPFLNIGTELATGGERGLLGLAFHPDYATNGLFYVNCTATGGQTQIRRYTVSAGDPDRADPASRQVVLKIDQPRPNHNGGWLAFGPDKLLYIATGDGGGANDPDNRAQNKADLLGKMLRIDVARDDFPADPARNYGIPAGNPFATPGDHREGLADAPTQRRVLPAAALLLGRNAIRRLPQEVPRPPGTDDPHVPQAGVYDGVAEGRGREAGVHRLRLQRGHTTQALCADGRAAGDGRRVRPDEPEVEG